MKRKEYGKSKQENCFLCGKRALAKNSQNLPACKDHTQQTHNFKCLCGEWLDIKESKYGAFFVCFNCGNISYNKGLEMNDLPLKRLDEL